jgi:hypothetical protein
MTNMSSFCTLLADVCFDNNLDTDWSSEFVVETKSANPFPTSSCRYVVGEKLEQSNDQCLSLAIPTALTPSLLPSTLLSSSAFSSSSSPEPPIFPLLLLM